MLNRVEDRIVPATLPMSRRGEQVDETVKQRSGWLIPIAVFVVTTVLSAVILLLYLAPTPASFIEEHPSPTSRADPIDLSVNGLALKIPANYIIYSSARQGGPRKDVALFTTFPGLPRLFRLGSFELQPQRGRLARHLHADPRRRSRSDRRRTGCSASISPMSPIRPASPVRSG
jgi:hypothetical protein